MSEGGRPWVDLEVSQDQVESSVGGGDHTCPNGVCVVWVQVLD